MKVRVFETTEEMARQAAAHGLSLIRETLEDRGSANIVLATGASQFDLLKSLAASKQIAWNRVTAFHLDEYADLSIDHPASFRLYLWQRFVSRLPLPLKAFYYLDGEGDCVAECGRVGRIIKRHPVDVAFVGIGENGHLAFNDPPADFETEEPYIVVQLDQACRRQQLGEGWFTRLEEVPRKAISMSIQQIMKSKAIVCTVPDERKAVAVYNAVRGAVTPEVPASILQRHEHAETFLDRPAASLLPNR